MIAQGAITRRTCWSATTLIALIMGVSLTAQAQDPIPYAQISSAPSVNSNQFVDIPGLSFQLPAASATQRTALIILNVPTPFAEGNNFPGLSFGINVNGNVVATGGFTYSTRVPESFGRMPVTVVVKVALQANPLQVRAQWVSIRNSRGKIDSFASLSAVLGSN